MLLPQADRGPQQGCLPLRSHQTQVLVAKPLLGYRDVAASVSSAYRVVTSLRLELLHVRTGCSAVPEQTTSPTQKRFEQTADSKTCSSGLLLPMAYAAFCSWNRKIRRLCVETTGHSSDPAGVPSFVLAHQMPSHRSSKSHLQEVFCTAHFGSFSLRGVDETCFLGARAASK